MCDDLGISGKKIEVFKFTYLGQSVIFRDVESLQEWIIQEIEGVDEDDPMEMSITVTKMHESELRALKEFDGY